MTGLVGGIYLTAQGNAVVGGIVGGSTAVLLVSGFLKSPTQQPPAAEEAEPELQPRRRRRNKNK